jgi:hypothetical protein
LVLTIIQIVLIAIAAILALGLVLWLIGLFLPARRGFKASRPIYLPPYLALNQINANPFPDYFRGERQGAQFVQFLDKRGRTKVTWNQVSTGEYIEWRAESMKAPCGSFRYTIREKGIISELHYERALVIPRPMMRLFGRLISLRRESQALLQRFEPEPQKT